MKKLFSLGIAGLIVLSGCQYGANEEDSLYHDNGNTINIMERNEHFNKNGVANGNDGTNTNFGYVRHQKSPVPNDNGNFDTPQFNREELADMISKLAASQVPNVNDVGTLVTDEEVLVVYEADAENREQTADQVRRIALSVVPRYFHVYVSDDPLMFREVERFGLLDSNTKNIDQILDYTINQMEKSPQGTNANWNNQERMNNDNDEERNLPR